MATHSGILAWRIPMDRGAWWTTVHGVAKNRIQLSDFTFTFSEDIEYSSLCYTVAYLFYMVVYLC